MTACATPKAICCFRDCLQAATALRLANASSLYRVHGQPEEKRVNELTKVMNALKIGAKFSGSVLGRPARANLAVYNQWIDNVQRAEFPVPPSSQSSIAGTRPSRSASAH